MPPDLLFVYGTLRRGSKNEFSRFLSANAVFLGRARMQGRLRRAGKYTAAVSSEEPEEWVKGEVFRLNDPDQILRVLDEYEGPSYQRAIMQVQFQREQWLDAWVYVDKRKITRR